MPRAASGQCSSCAGRQYAAVPSAAVRGVSAQLSNVYTVQRSTKCKIVTWGMGRRAQTTSEVVADGAGPRRGQRCQRLVGGCLRGGREEGARQERGQVRSERLGVAGAAIGCGSGLVAALAGSSSWQGHDGTATSRHDSQTPGIF